MRRKKARGCFLLVGQNSFLAQTGVQQDADRQWQIGLRGKTFQFLRRVVFKYIAIRPGQVRYQLAGLVVDDKKQVHQVDADAKGGDTG